MSHSSISSRVGQRFNPYRLFCGIHIPNVVCRSTKLTPTAKLVYGRLAQYAGENGRCFPAIKTLAVEIAASPRAVISAIQQLEREGFVKKQATGHRDRRRTNTYHFLWHDIFENELRIKGEESAPPEEGGPSQPVKKAHHRSENSAPKEIHGRELRKKTTTTVSFGKGCCSQLSDEQKRFIDLKVRHMKAHGRIKHSPGSLKAGLKRRAREGVLDLDELPELRAWASAMEKAEEGKHMKEALKKTQEELRRATEQSNKERIKREVAKSDKSPGEWWAEMRAEQKVTLTHRRTFFDLPLVPAMSYFAELFPEAKETE